MFSECEEFHDKTPSRYVCDGKWTVADIFFKDTAHENLGPIHKKQCLEIQTRNVSKYLVINLWEWGNG